MESVCMDAFMDGEWESLCRMLSFEEPNFGAQLITFPADDNNFHNPQNHLFSHGNSSNLSDSTSYNNFSSNTSYDNSHLDLSPCHEFEFPRENDSFRNTCYFEQENEGEVLVSPFPLDSLIIEPEHAGDSDQSACQGSPVSSPGIQLKRRYIAPEIEATPVKKCRISKHKGEKTVQSDLQSEEAEDNTNAGSSTHCATHENSDNEESNASQQISDGENSASKELVGSVTNSKGSKRASRGKATDPQSLYARRRRQRITERLRILQNLVPNGTKVDISTMLEEAVHYVNFLQLQLKLLSSDDLWMYAPIAYNGVDINLCRKISPFLLH